MHCLNLGLLWTCNGGTLTLSWFLKNLQVLFQNILPNSFKRVRNLYVTELVSHTPDISGRHWLNMGSSEIRHLTSKSSWSMHGRTTELGAKLMEYMLDRVALRLVWSLGTFRDWWNQWHLYVDRSYRLVATCQHSFLHRDHCHVRWSKRCTEITWRAKLSTPGSSVSGCWIAPHTLTRSHFQPAQTVFLASGWNQKLHVEIVFFQVMSDLFT